MTTYSQCKERVVLPIWKLACIHPFPLQMFTIYTHVYIYIYIYLSNRYPPVIKHGWLGNPKKIRWHIFKWENHFMTRGL